MWECEPIVPHAADLRFDLRVSGRRIVRVSNDRVSVAASGAPQGQQRLINGRSRELDLMARALDHHPRCADAVGKVVANGVESRAMPAGDDEFRKRGCGHFGERQSGFPNPPPASQDGDERDCSGDQFGRQRVGTAADGLQEMDDPLLAIATPVEHQELKTLIGERPLRLPLVGSGRQRAVHQYGPRSQAP
jgi:hypothetical protein